MVPLPVLAAFAGLDGARGEVCFALGFVVVEGDDDVGEEDDVGDDGGGGAGVGRVAWVGVRLGTVGLRGW